MRISDWSSDVCSSDLNNCRHPRESGDEGSSCRYRLVCRFPPCRIFPTPQRAVPRLYRSAGWGMLVPPRQPAHATALDAAQQRSNGCDLEQVVQPGRGTVFRTRSAKWNVTCSVSCPIAAVGCLSMAASRSRFRTRQGAIAIGEVKAYKLFQFTGIPSALAVFMDDTTSKIEVQFG